MAKYSRNSNEETGTRNFPDSRHLTGEASHTDKRHNSTYEISDARKEDEQAVNNTRNRSKNRLDYTPENGGKTDKLQETYGMKMTEEVSNGTGFGGTDKLQVADDYREQNDRCRSDGEREQNHLQVADDYREQNDRGSSKSFWQKNNKRRLNENRDQDGLTKRPRKKRSNVIFIVIIAISACVLVFAAYKLITIMSGYSKAANTYEEIAEIFVPAKKEKTTKNNESKETETTTANPFYWDYDALLSINSESVGWIRDGGVINYPIVHSTAENGNSKYLYTLIDGTENSCGTLFVDKNIPTGLEGNYSIVYGHNMDDHSMFGTLLGYQDSSYYASRPEMDVYIGYTHYVYKVFAAFVTSTDSYVYTYSLDDENSFNAFVEVSRSYNSYEMYNGNIVFGTNNIITLSTCIGNGNDNHRYVVMLCRDHIVKD